LGTSVRLRTNFSYHGPEKEELMLPDGVATVSDLLHHIGREVDFVFLDSRTGDLRPDIEVIVNGRDIWFYPGGLQRSLGDGDLVEISLIPLGGG
jgi:hypothetical protein